MEELHAVRNALKGIRSLVPRERFEPEVMIVSGSGLGAIAEAVGEPTEIIYQHIPGFPRSTVSGHSGRLLCGLLMGVRVAVLDGRAHLYEGRTAGEVVRAVRTLALWGAKKAILTNASGIVNKRMHPGGMMVIEDHLNLTAANPLVGPALEDFGPRFPDMTQVYDWRMRNILIGSVETRTPCCRGVYAAVRGPSYETPAEIRMLRALGADCVGMSTVPEAIALRAMGVRVAGISVLANYGAGIKTTPLTHEDVLRNVRDAAPDLIARILAALPKIAALK